MTRLPVDEKPRHTVRITEPFYLATTEVTVGQFREFVEDANYRTEAERDGKVGEGWDEAKARLNHHSKYNWRSPGFPQEDEHPVVLVSWNDAMEFIAWLGRKEGQTYRLPTEAEWEYACRAGTTTRFWVGDDPEALATAGNIAGGTCKVRFPTWTTIIARDGYVFTAPVGRFRPNEFGLYDMHGNVWEWCSDRYDSRYYAKMLSPSENPNGPSVSNADRVIRGGGWYSAPLDARSARRHRHTPSSRLSDLGFRVARLR